jgi:hypothetical protein
MNQNDLNYYYQQTKKNYMILKKQKQHNERHYARLVLTIKELFPQKYTEILNHIEHLYAHNIFIFEKGDIETYLGMRTKGLEDTIEFCHNSFPLWLHNKEFQSHREEINNILKKIFNIPEKK